MSALHEAYEVGYQDALEGNDCYPEQLDGPEPTHAAAVSGCTGTGEWPGHGLDRETVVAWAGGSLRHMCPGAKLGWNEILPLDPDADPLATVSVRWVPIELCTATTAVLEEVGR